MFSNFAFANLLFIWLVFVFLTILNSVWLHSVVRIEIEYKKKTVYIFWDFVSIEFGFWFVYFLFVWKKCSFGIEKTPTERIVYILKLSSCYFHAFAPHAVNFIAISCIFLKRKIQLRFKASHCLIVFFLSWSDSYVLSTTRLIIESTVIFWDFKLHSARFKTNTHTKNTINFVCTFCVAKNSPK